MWYIIDSCSLCWFLASLCIFLYFCVNNNQASEWHWQTPCSVFLYWSPFGASFFFLACVCVLFPVQAATAVCQFSLIAFSFCEKTRLLWILGSSQTSRKSIQGSLSWWWMTFVSICWNRVLKSDYFQERHISESFKVWLFNLE